MAKKRDDPVTDQVGRREVSGRQQKATGVEHLAIVESMVVHFGRDEPADEILPGRRSPSDDRRGQAVVQPGCRVEQLLVLLRRAVGQEDERQAVRPLFEIGHVRVVDPQHVGDDQHGQRRGVGGHQLERRSVPDLVQEIVRDPLDPRPHRLHRARVERLGGQPAQAGMVGIVHQHEGLPARLRVSGQEAVIGGRPRGEGIDRQGAIGERGRHVARRSKNDPVELLVLISRIVDGLIRCRSIDGEVGLAISHDPFGSQRMSSIGGMRWPRPIASDRTAAAARRLFRRRRMLFPARLRLGKTIGKQDRESNMERPPSIAHFSTATLARCEAASAWRRHMAATYGGLSITQDARWAFAEMTRLATPSMSISTVVVDAGEVAGRSTERQSAAEEVALILPGTGPMEFGQGSRSVLVRPGDGVLINASDRFHGAASHRAGYVAFKLPHHVLRARLGRIDDRYAAAGIIDRALVPALRGMAASLFQAASHSSATERLEDICLDVIAVMLDTRGRTAGRGSAQLPGLILDDLRAFIARHLGDAGLTIDAAAQACGVAVRTAQKLFQRSGSTFGHELMMARLDRADRLLARNDGAMTIGEIAFACGFVNQAHFATRYRQRFGLSPRDRRIATPAA